MKKTRLILALALLFSLATLAEAQIVVTSTTASTTHVKKEHPKSGREKGFVLRPEIEYGSGFMGKGSFGLRGVACYQFNPYWSVGGGLGYLIDFYDRTMDHSVFVSRPSSIPVFANARVYFIDRKWSPFFDFKIGYMIPLVSGVERYDSTPVNASTYYESWIRRTDTDTMRGFLISPTLGVQFKGFDFGINVTWFNVYHTREEHRHNDFEGDVIRTNYENRSLGYIGLTIAYNFQFK